jgi:glycosyltransferase involved in cell wall biosynthesis
MTQPSLVSIITPSYNQASFIEHTIRSILAQQTTPSADFKLEYIIVDGNSQDGSQEIIKKYTSSLAWWVSEPDIGQAVALNKGLRKANGDIVAWLNSDDIYLPFAVAGAVSAFNRNPQVGMVFGDAISINQLGRPLNRWSFGNWSLEDLVKFRIICQPAVFMRRNILEKAGYLDVDYHYMLDHKLWIQLAMLAPIQHIPTTWAAARAHPGAKNIAHADRFAAEILRLLDWIETQPALASLIQGHHQSIRGGAYRLSARYLLDGGLAAPALRDYAKALRLDPLYASKHWHRILYALMQMAGISWLADFLLTKNRPKPSLSGIPSLYDWPGISLN